MRDVLQSACNEVSFLLRNTLAFSPAYHESAEEKTGLFDDFPPAEKTRRLDAMLELEQRYQLQLLKHRSGKARYLETLTYLTFLEALLGHTALPGVAPLSWLDVGAKNWSYVEAPYRYLERHTSGFRLEGIELDPHRRYADFHTRYGYALAYLEGLPDAHYRTGDVCMLNGQYHVISHFLPFVVADPCLAWGLPLRYFQPEKLLRHLLGLLAPGGVMIVVNQGQAEADAQAEFFRLAARDFSIEWTCAGELPTPFMTYQYPRIGWICRKNS